MIKNNLDLWKLVISDFNKAYCGSEEIKKNVIELIRNKIIDLKINEERNFITGALVGAVNLAVCLKGIIKKNNYINGIIVEKYWEVLDIIVQLYELSKKDKS